MTFQQPNTPSHSFALKRGKIILLLVLSILFVVAGVLITITAWAPADDGYNTIGEGRRSGGIVRQIIGPIAVVFFGFATFAIARSIVKNRSRPGLVLTPEGFFDRTSQLSPDELVPWSEISGFGFMEQRRQRYLAFVLTEPQRFPERANYNRMKRAAFAANQRLLGPVHPVHLNNLKVTADELVEAIGAVTGGLVPFQGVSGGTETV
ncbi:MAG: STM3941 family protein [Gulosibacter sp.]|uniref:STM3941 family protein n=1 Tax=Gulosibacter sp. TaxID=2817531 RepID=UPI003F93402B